MVVTVVTVVTTLENGRSLRHHLSNSVTTLVVTSCGDCFHRHRIADPDTGEVAEHGWCDCLRAWRFCGWQAQTTWPIVTNAMKCPEYVEAA
jgi:hypothetical protein